MPFVIRDVAIKLSTDANPDNGWMAIVGCGPASVDTNAAADGCTGTQPPTGARFEAIDQVHGLKTLTDIQSLKKSLEEMLQKVTILELRVVEESAAEGTNPAPDGNPAPSGSPGEGEGA